jgi:hypothetical protein
MSESALERPIQEQERRLRKKLKLLGENKLRKIEWNMFN